VRLKRERVIDEAWVLEAPGMDARTKAGLSDVATRCELAVVPTTEHGGAGALLGAFDLALSASGTACLEASLAGVPTVVAYRLDALAYAVAKRLVTTRWVALPNVLLGRPAIPELLQGDANASSIARAATLVMDPSRSRALQAELRALLDANEEPREFGERAARLLVPWL
jgi:lipid-A-disaccharide synthase